MDERLLVRRSFTTLAIATAVLFVSSVAGLAVKVAGKDGDSEVVTVAGSTTSSGAGTSDTTAPPPGAGDPVTLLDAGSGPRRALRIRPVAGSTSRTSVEARITLDMSIDGERFAMPSTPGVRMVLAQRVDRVDTDGRVHLTLTYTDVAPIDEGTDPGVIAAVEAALEDLEGLHGTVVLDARGQVEEAAIDTSGVSDGMARNLLDSLISQISNLSAPFPREPVGIGARWTVTTRAVLVGITTDSTATYTLTGRDGDAYQLGIVAKAVAAPQSIDLPGVPGGTEASVSRFEVRTTGTTSGTASGALPTNSKVTAEGDIVMLVTADGETGRVVQHLEMEFTFQPA